MIVDIKVLQGWQFFKEAFDLMVRTCGGSSIRPQDDDIRLRTRVSDYIHD